MLFSRKYLFTSKKTSYKGIVSVICAAFSLISFFVVMSSVIKNGGNAGERLSAAGFMSLFFGAAGAVIGIVSLIERDTFRLFPRLGTILSVLMIIIWGGIIYVGFTGIF
ncbi:MAG: DUF6142 family protein [Lachnospiraceae bacterium]|nr:DUF6142 family protein [Lachnospiraceae bacterium]